MDSNKNSQKEVLLKSVRTSTDIEAVRTLTDIEAVRTSTDREAVRTSTYRESDTILRVTSSENFIIKYVS